MTSWKKRRRRKKEERKKKKRIEIITWRGIASGSLRNKELEVVVSIDFLNDLVDSAVVLKGGGGGVEIQSQFFSPKSSKTYLIVCNTGS